MNILTQTSTELKLKGIFNKTSHSQHHEDLWGSQFSEMNSIIINMRLLGWDRRTDQPFLKLWVVVSNC